MKRNLPRVVVVSTPVHNVLGLVWPICLILPWLSLHPGPNASADGAAPVPAPRGTVNVGPVKASGGIDTEIIKRIFVRRHGDELRGCYERGLSKSRSLAGQLVIEFTITVTGTASACKVTASTLNSPEVEGCVVAAIASWEFPRSYCGCESHVSVTLDFSPKRAWSK
jgi:hypothetical protein